jgi:uncharacterized membrane protein (UPF0136 family)
MSQHTAYTMAGLCALGGLMGFARKRSTPSLLAGLVLGAAFAYSGFLLQENRDYGHETSFVTSTVLVGAMGSRFLRTRKFMPAGLMAACGLVNAVYHAKKWYDYNY